MSASTFSLKIIIASNACGLVVDAEEVVVEKKCSTSRNIKEDLVHMSLENRLAGPIIFAREENNELEKKKNSEKQSPLELHFHVRLFYCCVPYFNETLFLNPLFAGKRGDVCVIVKTIFFFLHRKCCKIIWLVVKRVVIGETLKNEKKTYIGRG